MLTKINQILHRPIDASSIALYRILLGVVFLYQTIYYIKIDYGFQFINGPEFLFSYDYLPFIGAISPIIIKFMFFGMVISSILLILGVKTRIASIFLFLCFFYLTFVDTTLYNNHLYLFILILGVLPFLNLEKKYTISKKTSDEIIPYWQVFLLQFLIFITYFMGGVAKLNADWLSGRLPRELLLSRNGNFLTELFPLELATNLIAYGGILFDLSIVFLLINKKTQKIALLFVLIFNITNSTILFDDIGIFPFFMICSSILFISPKKIGNFLSLFSSKTKTKGKAKKQESTTTLFTKNQTFISMIVGIFVLIHLLLPLRYLYVTDNPEWSGKASKFAWRMKLQTRNIHTFKMAVYDPSNQKINDIDYKSFLSTNQYKNMVNDPYAIVKFAKYLKKKAIKKGIQNGQVMVKMIVSFNGRPKQYVFKQDFDLTTVDDNVFAKNDWLIPLKPISK